ncbi:unnamed protein product [Calypogeia fissa]
MAMVGISSSCAPVAGTPSASIAAVPSSSSSLSPSATPVCLALARVASLSAGSAGHLQSRCSFQQFEGLRGEGSFVALHSLCGISTKSNAGAFSVQTSSAVSDTPAVAAPSRQKIRIKLRSYWTHLIQQACEQILEAAKNANARTMGPVPLPTKRRVYCVLRSPHVDKDSREHFEIRTHHRLIDLMNPNAQTIDALIQLDLPAGVDVEVKLT